ncbi:hypothetical protein BKA70DRAFT_139788 [Coprinopsis sp. MPI-PUGE-AT-0042]|nr:hypothetical protein BKA70DRAFT_139788 [Coprinopsis sp. MPI-PUGE-AT-0042]
MDPHFQSQNSGSFPNASTVNISHGTFNDIRGNSNTYYYNNTYHYVVNHPPQPQNRGLCFPSTSAAPHGSVGADPSGSSLSVVTAIELCNPGLFPVIENTLELITHLVDSPTGSQTLFHRISSDLRDLVQLVALSSTAYQACTMQTPIGILIRSAIDGRLSVCNRRLVALHQEILSLPHHSIPLVRHVCRTLYQWWTSNEPEEIASIRSQMNAETLAFREWLSCLKSFYWASRLLLVARSEFRWKDLDALLSSGHTLLEDIHVEKIIIIEPLQGDQLVVPIRFVTSFEDIHHVVQLACQGTLGAKYIEDRQYELDDAATNVPVNPKRFVEDCLEDGKAFEVAMRFIQKNNTGLEDCPRCGFHHSVEEKKVNGWIRCRSCKVRFNTYISKASESDMSVTDREATSPHVVGHDVSSHHQKSNRVSISMMFRRLIIEILELPSVQPSALKTIPLPDDGSVSTLPSLGDILKQLDDFLPDHDHDSRMNNSSSQRKQAVVSSTETSGQWMPSNTALPLKSEDGRGAVSAQTTLTLQPTTHYFDQMAQPSSIHDSYMQVEPITGPLPFPDFTFSPAGLAFFAVAQGWPDEVSHTKSQPNDQHNSTIFNLIPDPDPYTAWD